MISTVRLNGVLCSVPLQLELLLRCWCCNVSHGSDTQCVSTVAGATISAVRSLSQACSAPKYAATCCYHIA
eukprot:1686-Heterococcus_DN1.PRE.1